MREWFAGLLLLAVRTDSKHINSGLAAHALQSSADAWHPEVADFQARKNRNLRTADEDRHFHSVQPNRAPRLAAFMHIPKSGSSFVNTIFHWLDIEGVLSAAAEVPPDCPNSGKCTGTTCGAVYAEFASSTDPDEKECPTELRTLTIMYPPFSFAGHRLYGRCNCTEYGAGHRLCQRNWWPVAPNSTEANDQSNDCHWSMHDALSAEEVTGGARLSGPA